MLKHGEAQKIENFGRELERLINMRGIDTILGMPDYQISGYLLDQLGLLQEMIDLVERSRRNSTISLKTEGE